MGQEENSLEPFWKTVCCTFYLLNSRASGFSVLIIIGFLLELSKTVMSILKQNFFAYYMAVGSIFSCATWQSSWNILKAILEF